MKVFQTTVLYGTVLIGAVCIWSTVTAVKSQNSPAVASTLNQTFLNEIPTGEILKKVGEFASRTLWVRKGKLILPTGTILTLAPKITVPAFRRKAFAGGLNSDFQATWFFYSKFEYFESLWKLKIKRIAVKIFFTISKL